jgi:WD40 repeat protein
VDARFVVALAFSPCGSRLVAVTGDNRHTVFVYDWQTGTKVHEGLGHTGEPPQVFDVVWNQHERTRDESGAVVPAPKTFVTFGVRHLKFWTRDLDGKGGERYKEQAGKFGPAGQTDVWSACFLPKNWLVTGTTSGDLLMWDTTGRKGGFASCIKARWRFGGGCVWRGDGGEGCSRAAGARALGLQRAP